MIPYESSYAFWISKGIDEYFNRIGFQVKTLFNSPQKEKLEPFDTKHWMRNKDEVKRFGLQVKRPYTRKNLGIFWKLSKNQHQKLNDPNFKWILYALPEFTDVSFSDVSCFHTIFKVANFPFKTTLRRGELRPWYYRWGALAERIINCKIGIKVTADNVRLLLELLYEWKTLVYDINLTRKIILCVKPEELSRMDIS